jgi:hypothetical protein
MKYLSIGFTIGTEIAVELDTPLTVDEETLMFWDAVRHMEKHTYRQFLQYGGNIISVEHIMWAYVTEHLPTKDDKYERRS